MDQQNMYSIPAPPKRRRRWPVHVAWAVGVLMALGVGAATASGGEAEPEIVVQTVTPEQVEVATVPDACVDALADADQFAQLSADFAGVVSEQTGIYAEVMYLSADAIQAAAAWDYATLDSLTAQVNDYAVRLNDLNLQIDEITSQVQTSSYTANRDACLAGG